jgi:hypothetical protein
VAIRQEKVLRWEQLLHIIVVKLLLSTLVKPLMSSCVKLVMKTSAEVQFKADFELELRIDVELPLLFGVSPSRIRIAIISGARYKVWTSYHSRFQGIAIKQNFWK